MSATTANLDALRATLPALGQRVGRSTRTDDERLERARAVMLGELDASHATYLETCLHCGMCADACHFYIGTNEAKYTPIYKVEPLKKVYQREIGPMRWLRRLVVPDISLSELQEWQPLVYDACTECGRCDLMCPMGIQISPMIGIMRRALAAADLLPAELAGAADEQKTLGSVFGAGRAEILNLARELSAAGVPVPLDLATADVVVLTSAVDIKAYASSFRATAKILNRLKLKWTLLSNSIELLGTGESLKELHIRRIVEEITKHEAKTLLLPECGHAYPALRFDSAHMIGEPLPFAVLSITEFVGREIAAGRLKVKRAAAMGTVTYHDPCKIGRHGGVFEEPRAAIKALGLELKEMESHGRTNYCCGGGGGQFMIARGAHLRQRAFEIKMREVDDTGAGTVLTACNSCRLNYQNGASEANWQKSIQSIVELVGANLAD
ncbi:MAG TPA: (Fe-S)-binding protein [Steroidobacteraceae bacterium]|nr:(Fe-S)-binding protein [Steroidobacteraceae bacterium]